VSKEKATILPVVLDETVPIAEHRFTATAVHVHPHHDAYMQGWRAARESSRVARSHYYHCVVKREGAE
jgi:hypothetical protein